MKPSPRLILKGCLLVTLGASAQAVAASPRPAAPSAVTLSAHKSPTVSLALQFHAGAVDDPPGKAGLTYLTARLLAEGGTEQLSAKQLLDTLYPMATTVRVRVDKEQTTFFTTVHRDHLARMIGLLGDVVSHPRWDPAEFTRLRDAAVNDVAKRLRQGDDEGLGKAALEEWMFRGHPYGRLTLGHVSELQKLTLAEVKAQAARLFTLDRLTIGLAGGYPANTVAKLRQAVASLPAHGAPLVAVAAGTPRHPRVLLVEKRTPSTAISIGVPWTLSRNSPDFAAWLVARSAFGEHRQFNGRLMQRLREARGLNYGDYAYIEHFVQEGGDPATAQTGRARHAGEFTIWLRPVQNENALFATRAALYELARSVTTEPFSDAEVARSRSFLEGYVLLYAQTDARKLGYALDDALLGGKRPFLQTLRASLRRVTTADVNRVWAQMKQYLPELQIVLVTPNAAAIKQAMVANAPSPMHYQKDADGKEPAKPAALLATDQEIAHYSLGLKSAADVEIIPVEKMFP